MINLVPIHSMTIEQLVRWKNDPIIQKNASLSMLPFSRKDAENWFDEVEDTVRFAIEEECSIIRPREKIIIGWCSLSGIDYQSGTAELGICIGESTYRNKKLGREVIEKLKSFAYNSLNLRTLLIHVILDNEPAIRCYRQCGFKLVGVLNKLKFIDGTYYDVVIMQAEK